MGLNRAALERLRLLLGDAEAKHIESNATTAERIEQQWLAKVNALFAKLNEQTLELSKHGELILPDDIEDRIGALFLEHELATVTAAQTTLKPVAHVEAAPHVRAARGKKLDPKATYETRDVLAGAYPASNPKSFLTHTVVMPSEDPICKRVKPESIADSFSTDPNKPPTCEVCMSRDPRFLPPPVTPPPAPATKKTDAVQAVKENQRTGKLPPRVKSKAAQIKALYIRKVQELWQKHGKDFIEGHARKPNGDWNPDAFDKEAARKAIQQATKVSVARSRTVVETETTRYYNDARREYYDAIDTVDGYLYAIVRDSGTTKWCLSRAGLVFFRGALLNKNTPPCHWNCRSELLPLSRLNPTHAKILADENLWASNHKLVPLPPGWNA